MAKENKYAKKPTATPGRWKEWKVGDIIELTGSDGLGIAHETIYRKIAEVRETGYTWFYPQWGFNEKTPGGAENNFLSEDSNDPFLEWGWTLSETTFSPEGEIQLTDRQRELQFINAGKV